MGMRPGGWPGSTTSLGQCRPLLLAYTHTGAEEDERGRGKGRPQSPSRRFSNDDPGASRQEAGICRCANADEIRNPPVHERGPDLPVRECGRDLRSLASEGMRDRTLLSQRCLAPWPAPSAVRSGDAVAASLQRLISVSAPAPACCDGLKLLVKDASIFLCTP